MTELETIALRQVLLQKNLLDLIEAMSNINSRVTNLQAQVIHLYQHLGIIEKPVKH